MDKNVPQEITKACITLLQQNAVDGEKARRLPIVIPVTTKKEAIEWLRKSRPATKKEAIEWLRKAGSDPDITFLDVTNALWVIYQRSKKASETRLWVTHLVRDLMRREDNAIYDTIQAARTCYSLSLPASQEQQEAIERLMELAKRRDIPWADTVEAAYALCVETPLKSKERQWALEMLLAQARWADISIAQAQEAAMARCYASRPRSGELNLGIQMLIELTRRTDLTFEDALVLDDNRTSYSSTRASIKQQQAAKGKMWKTIAQRPDLTSEQRAQVARAIEDYDHFEKQAG